MEHTTNMRFGPLVTNPDVRDWSVAASLFGSLSKQSGGRFDLAVGRGDSSRRVMGKKPHLHFAIYRRGRGAIDPVPYIAERTFATAPAVPDYEPGFAAVASARLNLRAGPGTGYARLDELPGGTPLQRLAASGEWLRVMTPLASNGWVHRDYLEPIENPGVRRTAEMDAWLLAAASGLAVPVSRLRRGAPLVVLADAPGWELVGTAEEGAVGWLGSRP
jgi:SH3-like domain-containing protein